MTGTDRDARTGDEVSGDEVTGDGASGEEIAGDDVPGLIGRLPEGWSVVVHDGSRWGASRTARVGGRVQTLWAEELGGGRHVSANVYLVGGRAELRPCEMPAAVVLDFLRGLRVEEPGPGSAPGAAAQEARRSR